jgi:hypothetical protein
MGNQMALFIRNIIALAIIGLLFTSCSHKKNTQKTNDDIYPSLEEPGFGIGNFKKSDTLKKAKLADPEIYNVIRTVLISKNSFYKRFNNRFNCEAKLDTSNSQWLGYFIKNRAFTLADTIGLLLPDTSLYAVDWSKLDNRNCIHLKDAFHSLHAFFMKIRSDHDSASERRKWFNEAFKCDNLVFLSYPKLNKSHTIAIVVMGEWTFGLEEGASVYILKKNNSTWKIIEEELVFSS